MKLGWSLPLSVCLSVLSNCTTDCLSVRHQARTETKVVFFLFVSSNNSNSIHVILLL